ncbi:hypothetical protein GCM10023116_51310 [Kistimonas scapharcae]|uniref:Uncharacterized protein n=1 Tax=Kistimonas scapharcae TaxID=1036133 RepID=A0ABP8VCW1_9GAMM
MKKDTLVAVGIVGCIVILGGLWLWHDHATVQPLPSEPEAASTFDPVPVYTDDVDPHSDAADVTRIIVSDSLKGSDVDIDQVLSDKVIVNDKVVNLPQQGSQ